MSNSMYVVEETADYSDDMLAKKCNELFNRGYLVLQIIEPESASAANGYKIVAYYIRGKTDARK